MAPPTYPPLPSHNPVGIFFMSLFTLIYFLYSIFLSQVLNYIYIFVLLLVCLPAPNLSTFSLAKLSYLAEYLINRNAAADHQKGK